MKFNENSSMEAEMLHMDEQMDMTKLIVAFCYFVNTPKKIDK